jgi:hypothetical protein
MKKSLIVFALFVLITVVYSQYSCISVDTSKTPFCKDHLPSGYKFYNSSDLDTLDVSAQNAYESLTNSTEHNTTTTCNSALAPLICQAYIPTCTSSENTVRVCKTVCSKIETSSCKGNSFVTNTTNTYCFDDTPCNNNGKISSANGIKSSIVLVVIASIVAIMF